MSKKQSGGVNIKGSSVDVGRDIVGRDKIEQHDHIYLEESGLEEKSGCAFAIERTVTFLFVLLTSSIVLTVILGVIGLVLGQIVGIADNSGAGLPPGAIFGGAVGLLMAIGIAIAATSSVSRYRKP
jgi:hypothetical protein